MSVTTTISLTRPSAKALAGMIAWWSRYCRRVDISVTYRGDRVLIVLPATSVASHFERFVRAHRRETTVAGAISVLPDVA